MGVALSSLRLSADLDVSGYVRSASQKTDADARMIASDKARNAALAQADAVMAKIPGGMASVSKSLLDGYGAGAQFEAKIRSIGNLVDRGMGLDRATILLDAAYQKFGLTADSAALAAKGFVSIGPAVDAMNAKLAIAAEVAERAQIQLAAVAKAQSAQSIINSQFGIGANDNSASRAADIAALGNSLDELRAKYSPLFSAQQTYLATLKDLNSIEARTALTENERAAAIQRTKDAFAGQVTAIKGAATATGLASFQMTNLGFQINDVATMLASGASPFQVIATQGGQVYQILSTANGGIGGALKSIGTTIAAMITPTRVAFGVAVAGAGLATAALISYESKLLDVRRQLTGMGQASGASVGDIESIAKSNSSLGGFSVDEARNMAAALAATGKVGVESIGPIVALGHDFAKTFGVDAKEATDILSRSFADPVRGADELNQRLGFLDANTKVLIESLVTQGNRTEAVRILTDKIKGSIADAADITGFWSRAWTVTGNAMSDFFDRVGRGADRLFDGGSGLDEKISNLTIKLLELQKAQLASARSPLGSILDGLDGALGFSTISQQIDAVSASLEDLRKKKLALTTPTGPDTANKQRGLEIDAIARATLPTIDATRKLHDETVALQEAFDRPELKRYISLVGTDLVLALNRKKAAEAAAVGYDPIKSQIADMESQVRLLDQHSPADRAREAAAAEARRQQSDTNAGTAEERLHKQALAALAAAGGQSALDGVEKMRVGTFGSMAAALEAAKKKREERTDDSDQRRLPKAA